MPIAPTPIPALDASERTLTPWHFDGHGINAKSGERIATVRGDSYEERAAAGNLMAAAPALLRALHGAMRTLRMMHGEDCTCGECKDARAAIAQAEGGK